MSSDQSSGEKKVKQLRLSKVLTIPEETTVSKACQRMAARGVDAVLLTNSDGLLCGIFTARDLSNRIIADQLRAEQTMISKVMTRNPVFVMADTLAFKALKKMVQGKFRHLPVVENGEVIAMLDITKCLYDAISRMQKAAEQETLRERMFKSTLSTIIMENTMVAVASPSDPVYVATKKMHEHRVNSVVIATENKLRGILTSKDLLMRVVAQNHDPELTLVEKVMTSNPECSTVETTIFDALHTMHDERLLNLPVLDSDGHVTACLDVLQITRAVISMLDEPRENYQTTSEVEQAEWGDKSHFSNFRDEWSSLEVCYLDIKKATNGFSESSKIGRGGYGSVYKGKLGGTMVAIKMLDSTSKQGLKEFFQELEVLYQMRHPHLVKLVGACFEVRALVYEYLPNGSLEDCLEDCPNLLTWQMRTRIIYEVCSALIYLHSRSVVHGDLKGKLLPWSSNYCDFTLWYLNFTLLQKNTSTWCDLSKKSILPDNNVLPYFFHKPWVPLNINLPQYPFLFSFFPLLSPAISTVDPNSKKTYIVGVDSNSKPSIFPIHSHWYESTLTTLCTFLDQYLPTTCPLLHVYDLPQISPSARLCRQFRWR